jgi:hypothetical protein
MMTGMTLTFLSSRFTSASLHLRPGPRKITAFNSSLAHSSGVKRRIVGCHIGDGSSALSWYLIKLLYLASVI